jgi:hypothetical protein
LASKASQKGLLTDQMTSLLYSTVNQDHDDRERKNRELDDVLLGKLHATCDQAFDDQEEAVCVLRRFLFMHYKMPLDDIDRSLEQLGLFSPSARVGVSA